MDPILAAAKFTKPSHRKAAEDFVAKYKKSGESEYPYIGHWVGHGDARRRDRTRGRSGPAWSSRSSRR